MLSEERKILNLESTLKDYRHNLSAFKKDYKEAVEGGCEDQEYIDNLKYIISDYESDIKVVEGTLLKLKTEPIKPEE